MSAATTPRDRGVNARFVTDHPRSVRMMLALVDTARHELVDLSPGECELVLTLVSYLNSCPTCSTYHGYMRAAFTEDVTVVPQLGIDVDSAECSDRERAIARYVIKLTLDASKVSPRDRHQFLAEASVSEATLSDVVLLTSIMSMTNRWQLGCETAAEVSRRDLCKESFLARHVGWYRALLREEPDDTLLLLVKNRYNTLEDAHNARVMSACTCHSQPNTTGPPGTCDLPPSTPTTPTTTTTTTTPTTTTAGPPNGGGGSQTTTNPAAAPSAPRGMTEGSLLLEVRAEGLDEVLHSTQADALAGRPIKMPPKRMPSPDAEPARKRPRA